MNFKDWDEEDIERYIDARCEKAFIRGMARGKEDLSGVLDQLIQEQINLGNNHFVMVVWDRRVTKFNLYEKDTLKYEAPEHVVFDITQLQAIQQFLGLIPKD
jgi:hypothetical protein